jgi:Na+(H+)/acetate symporter ActP
MIFGGIAIIAYLLTLNEIIDQAVQNGLKFSGSVFSHTGKGFWMIVVGFLIATIIPLPEKPNKSDNQVRQ